MTKFTKSILKIILPLASLGVFLIASIIVLIISQGRMIGDDGKFVQTGIIRVYSIPTDNVKAYVNGAEADFSDFRITNINPGIVSLKLSKEGYTPWEKQVKVESGIVKDVYAQLYPNTIPFTKVSDINVNKSFYSEDGQFIYYTVLNGNASDGIWRIKLTRNLLDFSNTQQITQIIKFTDAEKSEIIQNEYNIQSSLDNTKLLLAVGKSHYLYNLSDTSKKVNLDSALGIEMQNVQFLRDSQSIMFTQDNKYAFQYDLTTKQVSLIDFNADGLSSFAESSNSIYFIKNNKLMVYANKVSTEYVFSDKLKLLVPAKITQVYSPEENSNVLILASSDTLVYLDTQKDFVDVIDTSATFYKALSNGRLITYFKNDELHSYYVEDNFDATALDTSNYNIGVQKSAFTNLEFATTGKNIVLFNNNKITLMDFDGLNSNTILTDFNFVENKLLFANNSTEIYALIQEKDAAGITINNIYKFELKTK